MHYFKKIFVASVIALLHPLSASGTPCFMFIDSGGSCYDHESGVTYKNQRKYRPAATANILQYIGWKKVSLQHSAITDDLFLNFSGFRTDQGQGMMMEGSSGWYIGKDRNSSHASQPVPEPGTMLLMGLGMFGVAYSIRSRWQRPS